MRRFVIIRTNAEDSFDTFEIASLYLFHDGGGIIASTTHEDGHLPVHLLHHQILHLLAFLCRKRRSLCCCAQQTDEIHPVGELIIEQSAQCGEIHHALLRERSDERNAQSFEFVMYHII